MRRSRENAEYWDKRINNLFDIAPEMMKVTKRYDCLKLLLQETYPHIKDKDNIQMLKDIIYLDRIVRDATEEIDKEKKIELSQEWQLEHDYSPNHFNDIKQLKML